MIRIVFPASITIGWYHMFMLDVFVTGTLNQYLRAARRNPESLFPISTLKVEILE